MEEITTIKLRRETKNRLDRLKEYKRETYEEVLKKILFILNVSKKNPEKATRLLRKLDSVVRSRQEQQENIEQEESKPNK